MRLPSVERVDSKLHASSRLRCVASNLRRRLYILPLLLVALALYEASTFIVSLFHWAERHVDRDSYWHMFLFFAATLPFRTGLPIPIVHQAWAVATFISAYFKALGMRSIYIEDRNLSSRVSPMVSPVDFIVIVRPSLLL